MKTRLHDQYIGHPRARTEYSLIGRPRFSAEPMAADVSPIVLNYPRSLDNLLKHFQNIEKWMQHEKIHRLCVAEVPTAPNSREGSQFKKTPVINEK